MQDLTPFVTPFVHTRAAACRAFLKTERAHRRRLRDHGYTLREIAEHLGCPLLDGEPLSEAHERVRHACKFLATRYCSSKSAATSAALSTRL